MSARTRRTIQKRERFLELLSESGNVRASCAALALCRSTLYAWRGRDPDFAAAWDSALERGADGLEDEARRRAMAGSDILLIFLLKALRPEKYRERAQLDINKNITSDLKRLPRDELIRRLEALRGEQEYVDGARLRIAADSGEVADGNGR